MASPSPRDTPVRTTTLEVPFIGLGAWAKRRPVAR